jgi:hypothetical protein
VAVNTHAIIKQLLDADFLGILVLSNTQYVMKGMRILVPPRTSFHSKDNTYVCGSQVYPKPEVLPPNLAHFLTLQMNVVCFLSSSVNVCQAEPYHIPENSALRNQRMGTTNPSCAVIINLFIPNNLVWPVPDRQTNSLWANEDEGDDEKTNKQTPWSESASELYRPSDRRLSAK